jgi:peptidoglycan/xylan/chitin deacetylase (PgdA/CDA1 family)
MKAPSAKITSVIRNQLLKILPDSWIIIQGDKPNSIYLTFDDGPDPKVTPQLLELLKAKNAKATFFLIGTNIEAYPELVGQMIANGHSIGNHSYDHVTFHELEIQTQLDQIIRTNNLIEKITGVKCKLFRAPAGILSIALFLRLIKLGITSVHWSKDSMDWQQNCEGVISLLAHKPIKNRDIVLLHDDHLKVLGITEFILNKYASYQFEKI